MEPEEKICKNCAAYDNKSYDFSVCRRHAPHPQSVETNDGELSVSYGLIWPVATSDSWCLEMVPK